MKHMEVDVYPITDEVVRTSGARVPPDERTDMSPTAWTNSARDTGLTVDEVYGELVEQMNVIRSEIAEIEAAVDPTQHGYARPSGRVIEVDIEAARYDGTRGEYALELVFTDLENHFPDALATACDKVGIQQPRIERTTVGDRVIGRVRFRPSQIPDAAQGETFLTELRAAGWTERSAETMHHLAFDPGKISFKPGKISFKPGKISFKPGKISFKPGKISFKPAVILPQPAECDSTALNRILKQRWQVAMGATTGKQDVTVAVLDTGINRRVLETHPLFAGHSVEDELGGTPDFDLEPDGAIVDEYFGHGTLVAGIVAQSAPLAKINHEAIRNLGGFSDSFEIARDLPDIAEAQIVVLSFATSARSADDVPVLRSIIRHLMERDVLVVCAHGSISDLADGEPYLYPADFTRSDLYPGDEVDPGRGFLISVGSKDRDGNPPPDHREGATVDAFGVGVLSAFPHGNFRFGANGPMLPFCGWARVTGTSFAAPLVAGEIANEYIHSDGRRSPADIARTKYEPRSVS